MRRIEVAVVFGALCWAAAAVPVWGQCQANELAKLTASDAAAEDHFGDSMDVSGDAVIIGAPDDDNYNGVDAGAAYVYRYDPGRPARWVEETKLVAADGEAEDAFGCSVAIDGATAVVGAVFDDISGGNSGSAYVFRYDPGPPPTWAQEAILVPTDGEAGDMFGYSVSVVGQTAVVGAPGDGDNGYRSGAAYVFRYDPTPPGTWVQEDKRVASDGAPEDWFGVYVAIDGDTVAVGAPFDDNDNGVDAGSAYMYRYYPGPPASWVEEDKLVAADGEADDWFGRSVAVENDTAIVGAFLDDDNGAESGSAYVFRRSGGVSASWTQTHKLFPQNPGAYQYFGYRVSISGDRALIGAYEHGLNAGSAYVFGYDPGPPETWVQEVRLLSSDGAAGDLFGISVAIDGDTAVVGACWDDDACPDDPDCNSGLAYFFRGLCDCQPNGTLDICDIADGISQDCNRNGIPDICDIAGAGRVTTFATNLVNPEDIVASEGDYPAGFFVTDRSDNVVYHVPPEGGSAEVCTDCLLSPAPLSFPVGAAFVPDEFGDGQGDRLLVVNETGTDVDDIVVVAGCDGNSCATFVGNLEVAWRVGVEYVPSGKGGATTENKLVVTGFDTLKQGKLFLINDRGQTTMTLPDTPALWTPTLAPEGFGDFANHIFVGEVAGPNLYALDLNGTEDPKLTKFVVVPFDERLHGLRQIAFSPVGWAAARDPALVDERVLLISVASRMRPEDPSGPGVVTVWDQRRRLVAMLRIGPGGKDVEPRGLEFHGSDLLISDITEGRGALLRATIDDFGLPDCNFDGVPDECQVDDNDCNGNGMPDDCDIASGGSEDCNSNGIPDECDIDAFVITSSWATYDPGTDGVGIDPDGYRGAVFDDIHGYVYFAPYDNGAGAHGEVLRYDTAGMFDDPSSWEAYDFGDYCEIGATCIDPDGYVGTVFDGRYVYFAPEHNGTDAHGEVLRYDTEGTFSDRSSWEAYDYGADPEGCVMQADPPCIDPDGYHGAVFDGRYIYFVPWKNGSEFHGEVLRYDTEGDFSEASSWRTYDYGEDPDGCSAQVDPLCRDPDGYSGGVFDNVHGYVVFAPIYNGSEHHGEALLYDTAGDFTDASSWWTDDPAIYGVGNDPDGYVGAVFDGRYAYFAPFVNGSESHGEVLRYDTVKLSWTAYDPGAHGVGMNADGYSRTVFDGRYVYFVPSFNGTELHGEVLRYDTAGAFAEPSSWSAYDYGQHCEVGVDCNDPDGYYGAAFDGQYVYFAPMLNGTENHGEVLRYDTLAGGSLDCNRNKIPDECDDIREGDFTSSGEADLEDFSALVDCMAGPDRAPAPRQSSCVDACLDAFDFEEDGDVDLDDFGAFQQRVGQSSGAAARRASTPSSGNREGLQKSQETGELPIVPKIGVVFR